MWTTGKLVEITFDYEDSVVNYFFRSFKINHQKNIFYEI